MLRMNHLRLVGICFPGFVSPHPEEREARLEGRGRWH
jgi:hypothetical protein